MGNRIKNVSGLTLIEVIISIAIMSIIAVTFFSLFTMSAKTNNKSDNALKSTYVGRDVMEIIYTLNEKPFEVWEEELEKKLNKEYNKSLLEGNYKSKTEELYLNVEFIKEENNDLIRAIVKVSRNKDMKPLEAQYESYILEDRGV